MPEASQETTLCADDALQISASQIQSVCSGGSEAYLIMADAMPQIVWSAATDGSRDYFNQRWTEHTGQNLQRAEGWGWLSALHSDDLERTRDSWKQAARGRETHECAYRLYCADDSSYRWHLERALPVFSPDYRVVKWFGTCTDIEELKAAKAENEALNARLRRSMVETHHRVKNNLQIISALIDMQLMNEAEAIPIAEFERLGSHVRALAAVHDLLTIKSKDAQQTPLSLSLDGVLQKLLPVHQQTSPKTELRAQVADVELPGVQGTSLVLVINELISNAIKHGQGVVDITVSRSESQIVVTVRDNGSGFPPAFDPRIAANTGLDLILSLVELDLAGLVKFENQPSGGAIVTVTFPVATPAATQV